MNSLSAWTGHKNKSLTKIHVRPKRSLYKKLRQQPEKCNQNASKDILHDAEATSSLNYLDTDDSEEEIVTYELTNLKKLRKANLAKSGRLADQRSGTCLSTTDFVEKEIESNDTLHSIALRYGCKVSEIKRINNLINDQEFYGLRRVKVPVREHSHAKEQLEKENELKLKNNTQLDLEAKATGDYRGSPQFIGIRGSQDAREFLRQMDADLEKIRQSTKVQMDSLDEVTMSLTCKRFHPFRQTKEKKSIPTLRILIFVIITALIAFPIVFIILMIYRRSVEAFHVNSTHFAKQITPAS